MKGKKLLVASCILSLFLLLCGFSYANKNGFFWKEFYNLTGETAYYPVSESTPKTPEDDSSAPETVSIGDVFEGKDGYERVIAVSKDGAYVTEIVPPEEKR